MMPRHIEADRSTGLHVIEGFGAAPQEKDDSDEGPTRTARVARACRSSWRFNMMLDEAETGRCYDETKTEQERLGSEMEDCVQTLERLLRIEAQDELEDGSCGPTRSVGGCAMKISPRRLGPVG